MWSQGDKKLLDPKQHLIKQSRTRQQTNENEVNLSTTIVEPIDDLRVSNNAKNRRFEALLGRDIDVEKNEIEQEEDTSKHDENEQWELKRKEVMERVLRDTLNAMRRDETSWTDDDGYQQIQEAPAFREGYNTTLRVLPPPEEHLHNGLQLQRDNNRVSSPLIINARAQDIVTRLLSQRGELARLVGMYFMRGIQSGTFGDKAREGELLGGLREEIELILRNFEVEEAPEGYVRELTQTELQKRRTIIANAIGNAFLEIGMTLPAGTREDPRRNDVVAMQIGTRMMAPMEGNRMELPQVYESFRKEIAIALGRAMLHLKAAADVHASRLGLPVRDALLRDRTLRRTLGQMTLQFIENSASRVGKLLKKYSHRRETTIETIGNLVAETIGTTIVPENIQTPQFRNEAVNQRPLVPSKPLNPNVKRDYPKIEKRKP